MFSCWFVYSFVCFLFVCLFFSFSPSFSLISLFYFILFNLVCLFVFCLFVCLFLSFFFKSEENQFQPTYLLFSKMINCLIYQLSFNFFWFPISKLIPITIHSSTSKTCYLREIKKKKVKHHIWKVSSLRSFISIFASPYSVWVPRLV